jgi:microcystin-dependent protein
MTVVSPTAKAQFIDAAGVPLAGGLLYTYAAGTTTPQATYTDSTGATSNSNPIVLDSRGEANIWLGSSTYKFKLCDSTNTELWTVDNISAPSTSLSPVLSGNVTISTANSGTALTITQTGSGAALRVQDETDPDSTPFIIDTNGYVGIGTATPANAVDLAGGTLQISSTSGTARTTISADSTDSIFSANDSRNLTFKTNATTRLTINSTAATSTVPVVLPAVPTTDLQAATKSYVDGLTGAPSGVIVAFAGATAPTGFLACDGSAVSRTTYATLFAAISTTWGAGNGTTTFNVPDLRGMFVRGTGTNATGSSSGAVGPSVGAYAADTYLNHTHTDSGHTHGPTSGTSFLTNGPSGANIVATGGSYAATATTASGTANIQTSTTGGTETKPKNYGVLYIIKT